MFSRLSFCSACIISLFSLNLSADAGFMGLGNLSISDPSGQTYGMSEDGSVVVGSSYTDSIADDQAFRWSDSDGMVALGLLIGHNVSYSDRISGDGITIIGSGRHRDIDNSFAHFIWTQATGMQPLDVGGEISAISFDGSVLAGKREQVTGLDEAFRYSGGITVGLGFLETPDADSYSTVGAISADGSIIVGSSSSPSAERPVAYRWTQADGMVVLGDGSVGSPFAMSASGDVIVGWTGSYPSRGYIWTEATGANVLFDPGPDWHMDIFDISADGTTVVGELRNTENGTRIGWRWTEAGGQQSIAEWLSAAGVDSAGWTFSQAFSVSADGKIVAGYSRNPRGDLEPFIAWVTGDTPKPNFIFGRRGGSFEVPKEP
jgi:probable HAF family extracellular repeat protein